MELRPADKLIILMLTEIYDHLKVQGETDTAFLRNAIFGGHNWALRFRLTHRKHGDAADSPATTEAKVHAAFAVIPRR